MAEFAENNLRRLVSKQSGQIIDEVQANSSVEIDEEAYILALQAIKVGVTMGRISEQEKSSLQNSMKTRCPFDRSILMKLSKTEQFALEEVNILNAAESFQASEEPSPEGINELSEEVSLLTDETNEMKTEEEIMEMSDVEETPLCYICSDHESSAEGGIFCSGGGRHFQCFKCFTSWSAELNSHKTENFEALKKRMGLIKCPIDECEYVFDRAEICASIKDHNVLEGFMANLMYLENMKAFEEYQSKLQELQMDLKQAQDLEEENKDVSPVKLDDSSGPICTTPAERLQKRIELENLALSLKMNLPDARMCPKCNYGPQVKAACNDLLSHHHQVVSDQRNNSDDDQDEKIPVSRINNACPQCRFLAQSWDEWIPWTGALPSTVSGDAFKLGAADDSNNSKILSPEEVRRSRVAALERSFKSTAEIREKKEQAIREKKSAEETSKKEKLTSIDSQQEAYRKLLVEKQKRKREKELMLRNWKADRSDF